MNVSVSLHISSHSFMRLFMKIHFGSWGIYLCITLLLIDIWRLCSGYIPLWLFMVILKIFQPLNSHWRVFASSTQPQKRDGMRGLHFPFSSYSSGDPKFFENDTGEHLGTDYHYREQKRLWMLIRSGRREQITPPVWSATTSPSRSHRVLKPSRNANRHPEAFFNSQPTASGSLQLSENRAGFCEAWFQLIEAPWITDN